VNRSRRDYDHAMAAATPASEIMFRARIEVLPDSGREHPIRSGYICDFRLPTLDQAGRHLYASGAVFFEDAEEVGLGAVGVARVLPGLPDTWGSVGVGDRLPMHEGHIVVAVATVLEVTRPDR
jgi:hypothetical protein